MSNLKIYHLECHYSKNSWLTLKNEAILKKSLMFVAEVSIISRFPFKPPRYVNSISSCYKISILTPFAIDILKPPRFPFKAPRLSRLSPPRGPVAQPRSKRPLRSRCRAVGKAPHWSPSPTERGPPCSLDRESHGKTMGNLREIYGKSMGKWD